MTTIQTPKQKVAKLSLDIVNTMVKAGFTFFSSVALNTENYVYIRPIRNNGFAFGDVMFFHKENRAMLVKMELIHCNLGDISTDVPGTDTVGLAVTVFTHRNRITAGTLETKLDFERCREQGQVTRMHGKLIPSVTWCDARPQALHPNWDTVKIVKNSEEMKIMFAFASTVNPDMIQSLANSLKRTSDFMDRGQLNAIDKSYIHPQAFTSRQYAPDDEFWGRFNAGYFSLISDNQYMPRRKSAERVSV